MADERTGTEALAIAYENALVRDRDGRRANGAFYTPPELVAWVLDHALTPETRRVLDPACGTGHFLLAAARRLGDVRAVHGSDLDAEAVRIARLRLRAEDATLTEAEAEEQVRVADGLTTWAGETFDAVVGNPPFLGQLRRRTASKGGHGLGAYTDTSAVFLHRALDLVREGGTVALVQPISVLAARDATKVRAAVVQRGAVTGLWASDQPVFRGTPVRACVPVVRIGEPGGDTEWGRLAAPYFGIPTVDLPTAAGTVGDLATCTADFRDQYYGLVPHVREAAPGGPSGGEARLVTSGLIDPAVCLWGRRSTRFARREYGAPVVDVAGLRAADRKLGAWADARLVPKVLVAGQGRVVEAVVDEPGEWLPSVPVVSVVPHDPTDLWRLLAVLMAPPVVADAAARYLGAGLAPGSVKLSARQVAALALPGDGAAWAQGAGLVRRAQAAAGGERQQLLAELAATMTTAYGVRDPAVREWWLGRARPSDESAQRARSDQP